MKKVRNLLILLLAALMLTVFVGCNPDSGLTEGEGDTPEVTVDYKTFAGFKSGVWDKLPTEPGKGKPINYTELTAEEQAAFIADAEAAGFEVEFKVVDESKGKKMFIVNYGSIQLQQQDWGGWYVNDFSFEVLAGLIETGEEQSFKNLPGYPRYQFMPTGYKQTFLDGCTAKGWNADFSKGDLVLSIGKDIVLTQSKGSWSAQDSTFLNKVKAYAESKNTEDLGVELFADMTELELATLNGYPIDGISEFEVNAEAKSFSMRISAEQKLVQNQSGEWTPVEAAPPVEIAKNLIITQMIVAGNDKIIAVKNISGVELELSGYSYLENNKKSSNKVVTFPEGKLGADKTLYLVNSRTATTSFTCLKDIKTVDKSDGKSDLMLKMGADPYYWAFCTGSGGDTSVAIIEGNDASKIVDRYDRFVDGKRVEVQKNYIYTREYNEDPSVQIWKLTSTSESDAETYKVFNEYVYAAPAPVVE